MNFGYGNYQISSDIIVRDRKCKSCGKIYTQELEEQMPGFRQKDYDICPYCDFENGSSMAYEYTNKKND